MKIQVSTLDISCKSLYIYPSGHHCMLPFLDIYSGALLYLALISIDYGSENEMFQKWLDAFVRTEKHKMNSKRRILVTDHQGPG